MSAMNEESITKPIIYGSMAFWLGKKADEKASHKWVCYVRGVNNEDLSYYIKKVVFTLHPSFKNPIRTVTSPPFELHEMGWGEFEISLKIFFIEEYEKPIEILHLLKLHPSQQNTQQSTKKPVVSEFYDEIVFLNPSEHFAQILNTPPKININKTSMMIKLEDDGLTRENNESADNEQKALTDYSVFFTKFDETTQQNYLNDALAFIQSEVNGLKDKIKGIDENIIELNKEMGEEIERKFQSAM